MIHLLLGIGLGLLCAVCKMIDDSKTVPDPRAPAQRRAQREDCRARGL